MQISALWQGKEGEEAAEADVNNTTATGFPRTKNRQSARDENSKEFVHAAVQTELTVVRTPCMLFMGHNCSAAHRHAWRTLTGATEVQEDQHGCT